MLAKRRAKRRRYSAPDDSTDNIVPLFPNEPQQGNMDAYCSKGMSYLCRKACLTQLPMGPNLAGFYGT